MITTIDCTIQCTWLELIGMLPTLPNGSVVTIHEEGVNDSRWIIEHGALEQLRVAEFME